MLASLNHPNIAVIHSLEESAGRKFLVMELVSGETLADRIAKGAVPVDEAIGIAAKIAEALEAAHEKGITHRDLKPANIKVADDGTVKVLDFGLAKVTDSVAASAGASDSPTFTVGATQAGMILGTAAYMSPEQARGKSVDKRADIWAFGVVLYELLTGKQLFTGEDISEILAKVIRDEPNLDTIPAQVRPLLRRCLEKDPKRRQRDIGDVRMELEEARAGPLSGAATTAAHEPTSLAFATDDPLAVLLLVISAAAGIGLWRSAGLGWAARQAHPAPWFGCRSVFHPTFVLIMEIWAQGLWSSPASRASRMVRKKCALVSTPAGSMSSNSDSCQARKALRVTRFLPTVNGSRSSPPFPTSQLSGGS